MALDIYTTKLPDTKLQNSVTYFKKRLQGTDTPFFFFFNFSRKPR